MKMMRFFIYIALLGVATLTLSACKDKQEDAGKNSISAVEDKNSTQGSTTAKGLDISICNTYFTQMQTCANKKITQQNQKQLETSLSFLKQKIEQLDDQEQIARICQKNLDEIDMQKKQLGCI